MTIESAEGSTRPPSARPPIFRIVSCGCAPVGSFEYSAALPRAESAEAASSFRDQGLTGKAVSGKASPGASFPAKQLSPIS
jgi:hypothetical protein